MNKTLMCAVALLAMASNAKADTLDFLGGWKKTDYYLGLLISNTDIAGETGVGQDMDAVNATLGLVLSERFSIEARLGAGSDDSLSLFQDPVASYAAGMLRYHYTWSNKMMTYAALGGSIRSHSSVISAKDSQGGAAFALGLNLFGSAKTAVNIEYLYLGGTEASRSIGLGFHHYFGNY